MASDGEECLPSRKNAIDRHGRTHKMLCAHARASGTLQSSTEQSARVSGVLRTGTDLAVNDWLSPLWNSDKPVTFVGLSRDVHMRHQHGGVGCERNVTLGSKVSSRR